MPRSSGPKSKTRSKSLKSKSSSPSSTSTITPITPIKTKTVRKRTSPIDPLSITEDLGIQTFRRNSRRPWTKEEDLLLVRLAEECLRDVGIFVNRPKTSEYYIEGFSNLNVPPNHSKIVRTWGYLQMIKDYEPTMSTINDLICWDDITDQLPGRKSKDCRKRWSNSLDPNLKKGRWTPEEDELLLNAHKKFGPSWQKVALEIPGRTDDQCAKRYIEVLDPSMKEDRLRDWSPEEDLNLIALVKEHGTRWRTVSGGMNSRPSLTCRNRWRKIITDVTRGKADTRVKDAMEKLKTETPDLTTLPSSSVKDLTPPSSSSSADSISAGTKKNDGSTKSKTSKRNSLKLLKVPVSEPATPTVSSANHAKRKSLTSSVKLNSTPKAPKSRARAKSVSSVPSSINKTPNLTVDTVKRRSQHFQTPPSLNTTPVTQLSKTFERHYINDGIPTFMGISGSYQHPSFLTQQKLSSMINANATNDNQPPSSFHTEAEKALVGIQSSVDKDLEENNRRISSTLGDPLQSPVLLPTENGNLNNSNSEFDMFRPEIESSSSFHFKMNNNNNSSPSLKIVLHNTHNKDITHLAFNGIFNNLTTHDLSDKELTEVVGKCSAEGITVVLKPLNDTKIESNFRQQLKHSFSTSPPFENKRLITTPRVEPQRKSVSSVSSSISSKISPKLSRSSINSVNTTPFDNNPNSNNQRNLLSNNNKYDDLNTDGINFWDSIATNSNNSTNQSSYNNVLADISSNQQYSSNNRTNDPVSEHHVLHYTNNVFNDPASFGGFYYGQTNLTNPNSGQSYYYNSGEFDEYDEESGVMGGLFPFNPS